MALKHVSASQIKTYRRCNRRWYWESVKKFRGPESEAMRFGTLVHSLLETYLETGKIPTDPEHDAAWHVALPGIERLPKPPIPKDRLERGFWFTPFEVPVLGFVDLIEDSRVTDHKTTSDFRYQRTEEELSRDPQSLIYTAVSDALRAANPITKTVYGKTVTVVQEPAKEGCFRHVYYRTRGAPASAETTCYLPPGTLAGGLERIGGTISQMVLDSDKIPGKVEPNLAACGDYGGCPHRDRCHAIGDVTISGLLTQGGGIFGGKGLGLGKKDKKEEVRTMGLFKKIKAADTPAPAADTATTITTPEPEPQVPAVDTDTAPAASTNAPITESTSATGATDTDAGEARPPCTDEAVSEEIAPDGSAGSSPASGGDSADWRTVSVTAQGKQFLAFFWKSPQGAPFPEFVEKGLIEQAGDRKWYLTPLAIAYCREYLNLEGEAPTPPTEPKQPDEPTPTPQPKQQDAPEQPVVTAVGAALNPPDGTPPDEKVEVPKTRGRKPLLTSPLAIPEHEIAEGDPVQKGWKKAKMVAFRKALIAHLDPEQTKNYYAITAAGDKPSKDDLWDDVFLLMKVVNHEDLSAPEVPGHHQTKPVDKSPTIGTRTAAEPEVPAKSPDVAADPAASNAGGVPQQPPATPTGERAVVGGISSEGGPQKSPDGESCASSGGISCPTLYVGCIPFHTPFTRLETWLEPVFTIVAEGKVAPGDKPVPFWQAMPFNDDQRRLNQAVFQLLRAGELTLPDALVVDRRSRCACVVEVLRPYFEAHGYGYVEGY